MNDEDKKYLRLEKKKTPSLEVFKGMVQILANTQEKASQLLHAANKSLLKTFKTI